MKLSEFKTLLKNQPNDELVFVLPDGGMIPVHAHITEVGRIDRTFVDCGGTIRTLSVANFQAWVADDTDHRFLPGKLATVLDGSSALFRGDDLDVQIEYEDGVTAQFPVVDARNDRESGRLYVQLGLKHTDCLAKDVCLSSTEEQPCCSGSGCC